MFTVVSDVGTHENTPVVLYHTLGNWPDQVATITCVVENKTDKLQKKQKSFLLKIYEKRKIIARDLGMVSNGTYVMGKL